MKQPNVYTTEDGIVVYFFGPPCDSNEEIDYTEDEFIHEDDMEEYYADHCDHHYH